MEFFSKGIILYFGISITNISTEMPLKVGSRPFAATQLQTEAHFYGHFDAI